MTATRSMQQNAAYARELKSTQGNACPFCAITKGNEQYITESSTLKLIRNRYPYSLWDGQGVSDHLMIVPKRHTDSLATFNEQESIEYVAMIAQYEAQGYNVYSRAAASTVKTVVHQHTHLIKPDNLAKTFLLLLRKPFYIRFMK